MDSMNADCCGGMDFMESMIALMAVTVVLTAFMGMVAGISVDQIDPGDTLDSARFTGVIENERFSPSFIDYLAGYLDSNGLSGASVSVHVPGSFCAEPEDVSIGDVEVPISSCVFMNMVPADDGRCVPGFFTVTLCG